MKRLYEKIREAVADGRYAIGEHAAHQLEERGIPEWQVVAAVADGKLLKERQRDRPNPAVEVELLLPDGTSVKSVWSWLKENNAAKLVTVHYFDR